METIKMWAVGVCASAVIAAVYKILVPAGNMKKVSEVLLSLFLLAALVLPFLQAKSRELNWDFLESDFLEQTYSENSPQEIYRRATEEAVRSILNGMKITVCEIRTDMHTNADGNIVWNELCLSIEGLSEADRSRIRKAISEQTGIGEDKIVFTQ